MEIKFLLSIDSHSLWTLVFFVILNHKLIFKHSNNKMGVREKYILKYYNLSVILYDFNFLFNF